MRKSLFGARLLSAVALSGMLSLPAFGDVGTDFSGESEKNPWNVTTAGANVVLNKTDVAGNATPKLEFSMENQKGGRVATKKFSPTITGKAINVAFDWLPGKINEKESNPNENGGEVRLVDSNGKIIFTVNYTHNGKISWKVGKQDAVETAFSKDNVWYKVEAVFDNLSNKLTGSITDTSTGASEKISASLSKTGFSSVISQMTIVGIRTSGNNITWTTYLDNVNFTVKEISKNSITTVEALPYARVYVGSAKKVDAIGLPKKVSVVLADGTKTEAAVSKWKASGASWNTKKSGVYTFEGTIKANSEVANDLKKKAVCYVYNRLPVPTNEREAEWLDRGLVAVKAEKGNFVSWRILATEYNEPLSFDLSRNGTKIAKNLSLTNFADKDGLAGDSYKLEVFKNGALLDSSEVKSSGTNYLGIKVQKPEDGKTAEGTYSYRMNDASVGDLDGDGTYEIIVKWYPTNAIDSSEHKLTGPTLFDAYKLDGTLLWRIDMGLNLTSGAHYNQIVVADFNGDGKSEVFLKTADGTTVYGTTNGKFDKNKVISVIGNASDNGKYLSTEGNTTGHITGGPEYVTFFEGESGKAIDTAKYAFPVGDVSSWGDTWYNRSDRWNACSAYLDGKRPSAVLGRGYYARTAYAAYDLVNGKIKERWTFDSDKVGRGGALGNHNLVVADVDNDGKDEILAGDLTLDDDGSILYTMDGDMLREEGSHADAIHIGQFFPETEGLFVWQPREEPAVASLVLHDAATGEAKLVYYASKDAGRAVAANITSEPGYEVWGAGGKGAGKGGAVYDVYGKVIVDDRAKVPSMNFKIYWDGDLLHELLDDIEPLDCINLYKFDEKTKTLVETVRFTGTHSNNGTKANPSLQADILGDWREEVVVPSEDDTDEASGVLVYTVPYVLGLFGGAYFRRTGFTGG